MGRDLKAMMADLAAKRPNPDRVAQTEGGQVRKGRRIQFKPVWKQQRDYERVVSKDHEMAIREDACRILGIPG